MFLLATYNLGIWEQVVQIPPASSVYSLMHLGPGSGLGEEKRIGGEERKERRRDGQVLVLKSVYLTPAGHTIKYSVHLFGKSLSSSEL